MSNLPALKLTPKDAVERIKEQFPDEYAVLDAVVKNNIVALGTDEAFALRDQEGIIRAYRQSLTFSKADGTLTQPVPGGPHVVSAQGYELWARDAGACVIFPSDVLVDGVRKQNPFVQRDEGNRRILYIYARAVAFMFSPKGIPMVSDWTTIFDTPSYRMIDLLAKAKETPQAFRLLPAEMKPETKDGDTWASYPFDESTKLWLNTAHPEALKWFAQIINREKKAIDFAQTFAKRNALKHLSGLQKAPGDKWTISILCWRPTSGNIIKWDATQYANIQNRVGKIISGDHSEFAQIEMNQGKEHASDEEGAVGLLSEVDPEDQVDVIDVGPEQPETKPDQDTAKTDKPDLGLPATGKKKVAEQTEKEESAIIKNLRVTIEQFPDEFADACIRLKIPNIPASDYSDKDAAKLMKEVSLLVDRENTK